MDMLTILGPTASGKTSFATALASTLDTEIISADSRQVYRGMDLGTGKDISEYHLNGKDIPYHLIDIVPAGYKYNVYEYQKDFLKAYQSITNKNKIPILCGGTGMYLEAVLAGYRLIDIPKNTSLRNTLEHHSQESLVHILKELSPTHNTTDTEQRERTIRAIEIATFNKENPHIDHSFPKINSLIFGIEYPRNILRERITLRLKQRLRDGMIDEVEQLISQGVGIDDLKYYGLEYKYIAQFLNKEISYNTMFKQLNTAIHQFSKRQGTWFRKMEKSGYSIHWIQGELSTEDKVTYAMEKINTFNKKEA